MGEEAQPSPVRLTPVPNASLKHRPIGRSLAIRTNVLIAPVRETISGGTLTGQRKANYTQLFSNQLYFKMDDALNSTQ